MTYRVYFNREREWPQCWSFDEGSQDTEVNVIGFRFLCCPVESRELPQAARVPEAAAISPFAWMAVEASSVTLEKGVAVFHA